MQKDLTEVKIFQKVFLGVLFSETPCRLYETSNVMTLFANDEETFFNLKDQFNNKDFVLLSFILRS